MVLGIYINNKKWCFWYCKIPKYLSINLIDRISTNLFVDKYFGIFAISKTSFFIINVNPKHHYKLKNNFPPDHYMNCIRNGKYANIFDDKIEMNIKHGKICESEVVFSKKNAFIFKRIE